MTNGDRGRGSPRDTHWANNNGLGGHPRSPPPRDLHPHPSPGYRGEPAPLPPHHPLHHDDRRRLDMPAYPGRASPYDRRGAPPPLAPMSAGSPHGGHGGRANGGGRASGPPPPVSNKDLIAAARAAGLPMQGIDPSDPMSALLAAAKVTYTLKMFLAKIVKALLTHS